MRIKMTDKLIDKTAYWGLRHPFIPNRATCHIILKELKNGLITFSPSMIKIEADFIKFGSPKEQERLKKKYEIDSKMPGGDGG